MNFSPKGKSKLVKIVANSGCSRGGKDLTCSKSSRKFYNKSFFSRGSIHVFGLQIDLKLIFSEESVLKKVSKKILSNHLSNFLHTLISRIFSMLFKIDKYKNFSVKSSWEVRWIIMFLKDAVWDRTTFCQRVGYQFLETCGKATLHCLDHQKCHILASVQAVYPRPLLTFLVKQDILGKWFLVDRHTTLHSHCLYQAKLQF